jgi:hypothetical protein
MVYSNGEMSDIIYRDYSTGFVYADEVTAPEFDMTINIPTALYTSDGEITQFVNNINIKGTSFNIVTY